MKDKLKEVAIKAIDHIISGISQEEMAVFIKVLSKMAENMNEETNLLAIAGQGEHPSEIEY
jgi:hypothetical protein